MNPEFQPTTPIPEELTSKKSPEFTGGNQISTPEIDQHGIERGAEAKEAASEVRALAGDLASIITNNPAQNIPSIPTPSLIGPSTVTYVTEAADEDEIEKKWVDKTQEIISSTKGDPFEREKQIVSVREEYQKKRFNRNRGEGNQ